MFIVKNRKIFYIFSGILIGLSIFAIAKWGLNFGIDFKGGSIVEVEYVASTTAPTTVPTQETLKESISTLGLGEIVIRQTGDSGYIIRTKTLTDPERISLTSTLGGEIKRFDSVGPVLGKELQGKAIWSIALVVLAIVLFIAYVFRNVSRPISSWKYGAVAVVALFHDIVVPLGVFAYLGHTGGYEIDALFVTALLVILGFSIHDTIVVFDRTRENLKLAGSSVGSNGKKSFEDIVGESVGQTLSRSVNTSLTTILALFALYFMGPETTRTFSLALIIGIAVGTYSSVFIASPLLVSWERWGAKKGK